jgi:hypothetical protein
MAHGNQKLLTGTSYLFFKDGYFTYTEFTPSEFLSAWGGITKVLNNKLAVTVL